jgi:hypothetical protein
MTDYASLKETHLFKIASDGTITDRVSLTTATNELQIENQLFP